MLDCMYCKEWTGNRNFSIAAVGNDFLIMQDPKMAGTSKASRDFLEIRWLQSLTKYDRILGFKWLWND